METQSQERKAAFFRLVKTSTGSRARAGIMRTAHGEIPTPMFMPVGTQGSVKGLSSADVARIGSPILLGNTYHLYLRPGLTAMRRAGGLHRFMQWSGSTLTDSGGFQVWSLKGLRKIRESGVTFQSHIDGSRHEFTPESVMEAQRGIGADVAMAFDECTPHPATPAEVKESLDRTQRWLERCAVAWDKAPPEHGYPQALFAIVQGGMLEEERLRSVAHAASLDLPGYAIGGLSVGEPAEVMYRIAEVCTGALPADKPRYVMGVGTPENLLELISRGVDLFDCVLPTRNARNGTVFTWEGPLHYKAARHAAEFDKPFDPDCGCEACRTYSRGYLRHLFLAGEMLALRMATLHSLYFYRELMGMAREQILRGTFEPWRDALLARWARRRAETRKSG